MASPSEFKLIPVTFKPGINRNLTAYAEEGSWYSMDKVRFRDSYPQTIGGWQSLQSSSFKGFARNDHSWVTLDSKKLLAVGTNNHFYIWYGGQFNDITPVSASATTLGILGAISGSTSVSVSITGHGRAVGDYFYVVNQAVSVGGPILLSGEYPILTVNSANVFSIDSSVTATGTNAAGGGNVNYLLPIASGYQSNNVAFGYGRGAWSSGGYGVPVSGAGVVRKLRNWSIHNWGEDLLFNPKAGGLYVWDATNGLGTRGVVVTAAPSIIDFSDISYPTRHVVAFGTHDSTGVYDPLLVRWSSDENYNDWTVSAGNTAGDYRLEHGSYIVAHAQTRSQTLIWTDTDVYTMRYIGSPFYFGFDKLGGNSQIIGQNATIDIGGVSYWMGTNGFYSYDGKINQLNCSLQKDIFDYDGEFKFDLNQTNKTFCGSNQAFNEVIWFYQTEQSTTGEIDFYVIYNYQEDCWYYGTLTRTTWLDTGIFDNVYSAGTDGYLYAHELGITADGLPLSHYIESAPFDLGDGDELLFLDRLIPDFQINGEVQVYVKTRKYPNADEVIKGPYAVTSTVDKVDLRARGRQASIRIEASTSTTAWKLGKMRMRVREDGRN